MLKTTMCLLLAVLTVALPCVARAATAQQTPYQAGVSRIAISESPSGATLVWYPTEAAEEPWKTGPFTISATRDAAIAPGPFPIVLLSHGGGATGGSPLLLQDVSRRLAREGFVVIAPLHGKTRFPGRPAQVVASLAAVTTDPRFASHLSTDRIGMIGFSLGGAVALDVAGAVPDFAHLAHYCATHADDTMTCRGGPKDGSAAPPPLPDEASAGTHARTSLPLKALVLLDPLGVPFQAKGLTEVTMPVLLFRPEQSALGEANARTIADGLPGPPQVRHVPGSHFIFADVCSAELRAEASAICDDPQDVDRAAIHTDIGTRIVAFLHETL